MTTGDSMPGSIPTGCHLLVGHFARTLAPLLQRSAEVMRKAALTSLSIAAAGALLAVPLAQAQVTPPPQPRAKPPARPTAPTAPTPPSTPELLSVLVHQPPKQQGGD